MAAKYITISKASSLVGEKVFILKQWEEEYSEFITIKRDDKNARLFTAENIEFFQKVKAFKESNMDTQTIKQLFQSQRTTSTSSVQEGNDVTELHETLSKITSFIESQEVQNMLKLDERLEKLEKNVVSSVSEKITETAKLQTEVARFEFSDVQDMITSLAVTAEAERASYKEEIEVERELAQKKTDEREERFLTFVKEHQYRSERMKQEQKSGLGFLKQILSFAR
ncbi:MULTISPECIES: MerR family transcriptional regulator [Bacillaceae]|uniref:MerR family transcriptional regulator n=1 Tax=Bacillaceae TaxID=186817 RepID=UPI00159BD851|nr:MULTISPECIES: MerR family transcriptional regulator [Bacillaceae]UGB29462.1 helix-turn-helix domain-containing protein [Metabacillus sp. B2-18]